MELIMYHVVEVKNRKQKEEFLRLPALLYKREDDDKWISPLYSDTRNFFNPRKNPLFKEGEACRWLLYDVNKNLIGRIAAFYWKNSGLNGKTPMGYFGFFECANDKWGSQRIFQKAQEWLRKKGMKGMEGPFHLGGPGFFTGSLIRGFFEPIYGAPYNFSFYNDLFLNYGFEKALNTETYRISLSPSNRWKFLGKQTPDFLHDLRYRTEIYDPKKCEKFAADFTEIFNRVWADFPGMAPMTLKRAKCRCRLLRPVLVRKTIFFVYFEEKPIAFFIAIPNVQQVMKHFKGKYNFFERLFMWFIVKVLKRISTLSGLIYGVIPEFRHQGLEAVMLNSLYEGVKSEKWRFTELMIGRIGDFAPEMKKVVQQLNGKLYHRYVTFQLLFDKMDKKT